MATTHGGGLIAELSRRAPQEGGNTGAWPGLTIYRFTSPGGPTWEEIQSLSLCIVAQGRKAVTVDGTTYQYDPFHYLVLASASPRAPTATRTRCTASFASSATTRPSRPPASRLPFSRTATLFNRNPACQLEWAITQQEAATRRHSACPAGVPQPLHDLR
jgi:AraC-type transcriptional regulator N-terminus